VDRKITLKQILNKMFEVLVELQVNQDRGKLLDFIKVVTKLGVP
jgi:hypothetical protein